MQSDTTIISKRCWSIASGKASSQSKLAVAILLCLDKDFARATLRFKMSIAWGRSVRRTSLAGQSPAMWRPTIPHPEPSSRTFGPDDDLRSGASADGGLGVRAIMWLKNPARAIPASLEKGHVR